MIAMHSTVSDTLPNTSAPGGTWTVKCMECDWSKSGKYARTNEIAEYVALRLANAFGAQHEAGVNPEDVLDDAS